MNRIVQAIIMMCMMILCPNTRLIGTMINIVIR